MAAAASDASVLEAELARVQNACSHLEQSNVELRDAIRDAGYDREYKEAIEENIVLIAKYRARIAALQEQIREAKAAAGDEEEPEEPAGVAPPAAGGGAGSGAGGGSGGEGGASAVGAAAPAAAGDSEMADADAGAGVGGATTGGPAGPEGPGGPSSGGVWL